MPPGKLRFLHTLFLKNKEQTSEKMAEQCFLGKIKPTCQNSAIFEQFFPAAFQLMFLEKTDLYMDTLTMDSTLPHLCSYT